MIDTNKVQRHAERLERVAGGASPTPSFQVMARDAAKAIRELLEALGQAEEPTKEEQAEEPKPAPVRRGRKPKTTAPEVEKPAEGDDA